jgi:hypothetical protein
VAVNESLMTSLAGLGIAAADYEKIRQARELVGEANEAIAARGGTVVYALTMHRAEAPSAQQA